MHLWRRWYCFDGMTLLPWSVIGAAISVKVVTRGDIAADPAAIVCDSDIAAIAVTSGADIAATNDELIDEVDGFGMFHCSGYSQ